MGSQSPPEASDHRFGVVEVSGTRDIDRRREGFVPASNRPTAPDRTDPSASPDRDATTGPTRNDRIAGFAGTSIPSLEPGEAIRLHAPCESIRFLWPTNAETPRPFVSVLVGTDGSRYPLYLDDETAARYCRFPLSVVPVESIPAEPPPHALVGKHLRSGRG